MPQYWIAGAMVQNEDVIDTLVEHSFWYADSEAAQELIPRIQMGDRLAIKRMRGPNDPHHIAIRAIGEAQATKAYHYLHETFTLIYVKWIRLAQERIVPIHNWM